MLTVKTNDNGVVDDDADPSECTGK